MSGVNESLLFVRIVTPEDSAGRTVDSDIRLRAALRDGESPLELLAILLAGNLNALRLPRPYHVLAQVLMQLQQWHWSPQETERGQAEQDLLDAAQRVVDAWDRHDLKHKSHL